MKQLTLNGKTLGVVDVPEDAYDIFIGNGDTTFCDRPYDDYLCMRLSGGGENRALPPGQWSILGRLNDITEEQAAMIMPKQYLPHSFEIGYQSYPENDYNNNTGVESLKQFFRSHGITGNPLVLLLNDKV